MNSLGEFSNTGSLGGGGSIVDEAILREEDKVFIHHFFSCKKYQKGLQSLPILLPAAGIL